MCRKTNYFSIIHFLNFDDNERAPILDKLGK